MKKLLVFAMLMTATVAGGPRIAASLGYDGVSIQDNLRTLKDALDSVTQAFGR